ncbi:MAG TPA: aminopeptidase P N-terminal domain-containing protein, partial [Jatrophihabitantaceae bacterium]|nr:aminopeptidase P N-terminal domain-containing protein [Jatrophihabitantaceae bacterium]
MTSDAEIQPETEGSASHDVPISDELRAAIAADWDPAPVMPHPARADGQPYWARRRAALSAAFPGQLVVVPAGPLKARANDTDYAFRAASSFTWLTGETVESAVLVMTPTSSGHDSTLYVVEYAAPGQIEYFTDRVHGALWVGNVPSPAETG